jgi:hypothetical protein
MTTKMIVRLVAGLALATTVAACDDNTPAGTPDMAAGPDMATAGCVMNPQSGTDILNACTDSETGDATKDAPYFPSLTPGGVLPALP